MVRKVVTSTDIGTGLKIEANKLVVDVAALGLTDLHLTGATVNKAAKTLTLEIQGGTNVEVDIADFLAVDTDTKITTIEVQGKLLKITDSASEEHSVDLTEFAASVVEDAKGEEIQDLAGNKLGYLIKAE